jgi:hypothetical protein
MFMPNPSDLSLAAAFYFYLGERGDLKRFREAAQRRYPGDPRRVSQLVRRLRRAASRGTPIASP